MTAASVVRRAALVAAGCVLAGCAVDPGTADARGVSVVVGIYPLQFIAERVGGDRVDVVNLTPPGAEPHDLELNPQDVARVLDADLVLHLSGLQPATDDAVAMSDAGPALDAADHADLTLAAAGDDGGTPDPHFWLDPTRLSAVAGVVADQLAELDPQGAATYRANLVALRADLDRLDTDFSERLTSCRSRLLVTSHQAFGYLADRYELEQVGIAGRSPDVEPAPADLAEVAELVRASHVTTVFHEPLVSRAVADAVAGETGAATSVLDPLEGLAADATGDYLSVMADNLAALQDGLGCR